MEELAVIEQGHTIGKESERFIINNKDKKIAEVPAHRINAINIYGNNQITTQAISLALDKGIDINFLKLNGQMKGKITSNNSKNIFLRLKQYKMYEKEEFKIEIAKIIVKNKILNQYNLLKYHYKKEDNIIKLLENIDSCKDINELMGYEGTASKIYFNNVAGIVPEGFIFEGRNRRPPKDEVNALLSLTYQMLLNRITANLEIQGLDTTLGMLHSIRYGRESLSLDILEEFRQGFCDPFVFKQLNRKQIKKEDFEVREDGGYYLSRNALKEYLREFNKEYEGMEAIVKEKAILIRKAIEDDDAKVYSPYTFSKRR